MSNISQGMLHRAFRLGHLLDQPCYSECLGSRSFYFTTCSRRCPFFYQRVSLRQPGPLAVTAEGRREGITECTDSQTLSGAVFQPELIFFFFNCRSRSRHTGPTPAAATRFSWRTSWWKPISKVRCENMHSAHPPPAMADSIHAHDVLGFLCRCADGCAAQA